MTSDVYRPLDLSRYRNAPADVLGVDPAPPTGAQRFRGLPFEVGMNDRAFVEPRAEPVTIAVNATACTVIVAHRLLDARIAAGGSPGAHIADYVFTLADGTR